MAPCASARNKKNVTERLPQAFPEFFEGVAGGGVNGDGFEGEGAGMGFDCFPDICGDVSEAGLEHCDNRFGLALQDAFLNAFLFEKMGQKITIRNVPSMQMAPIA